jgi:hypothetical protein
MNLAETAQSGPMLMAGDMGFPSERGDIANEEAAMSPR